MSRSHALCVEPRMNDAFLKREKEWLEYASAWIAAGAAWETHQETVAPEILNHHIQKRNHRAGKEEKHARLFRSVCHK